VVREHVHHHDGKAVFEMQHAIVDMTAPQLQPGNYDKEAASETYHAIYSFMHA
jgi:hypothetical protein